MSEKPNIDALIDAFGVKCAETAVHRTYTPAEQELRAALRAEFERLETENAELRAGIVATAMGSVEIAGLQKVENARTVMADLASTREQLAAAQEQLKEYADTYHHPGCPSLLNDPFEHIINDCTCDQSPKDQPK